MSTPKPRQQLLLVKELYKEAEQASGREDTFSTSKGILFLDLAVEQMLLTIITMLPSKVTIPKGELKWEQLWQTASEVMADNGHSLPGKVSLKNLHQDRNRVQHAGSTFHFTQVRKHIGPVHNMVGTTFQEAFALDFENFREWDFIENEDLRRWLRESEDFLEEGNALACIVGCIVAYGWVIDAVRKQTKLGRMRRSIGHEIRGTTFAKALNEVRKELLEDIRLLENEVVAIGVGLPVMDTRRFLKFTRVIGVFLAEAGNISVARHGHSLDNDPTVANFMLEYLARLIQLVADGYPDVLNTISVKLFPKEQEVWLRATV